MIPTDFGFKVKGFFYSFIVFTLLSAFLYNQRVNLGTGVTSYLQGTFLWDLIEKWQLTEWLSHFVWGPIALSGAFIYNKVRNNRRKGNQPNEFNDNVLALNQRIDKFAEQITTLNENIFDLYKYFNPVLTESGVLFEMDEIGKIRIRDALHQAEENKREREYLDAKAQELDEKERTFKRKVKAQKTGGEVD